MQRAFINGGWIRRIYPGDRAEFAAHLIRLDAESRHDRFAMAVSDAYLESYVKGFFAAPGDVAYGWFVDGELRGAGELRQANEGAGVEHTAEGAFSVERDFRRGGVGEALMARIVRAARNRRDSSLCLLCLAENRAMQSLAKKFSAELTFGRDQITGRLVARHLSAASLWNEWADDARGLVGTLVTAHHSHAHVPRVEITPKPAE